MKNGMLKRAVPGSFTVEAAFICPIVLLVIFTLLMHAFRLHDRVLERTALSLEVAAAVRDGTGEMAFGDLSEGNEEGIEEGGRKGIEKENAEERREVSERTRRLLSARLCETENELLVERGVLRISGSVGEYGESRLLLRPEDILRKKVLFEEEDH